MRLAKPFPVLHALNAGLSMVFSLCQTLVFARSLSRADFAVTIAAITISFYLLPINQAVARANFHLIRRSVVAGHGEAGHSEAAAAFHVSQLLMLTAGLAGALILDHSGWRGFLALAAFTVANNFANFWYFEVQTTILAVDRPVSFEVATLLRRVASFAALGWLYVTHDFLVFGLILLVLTLLAQTWVFRDVARRSDLFDLPRRLSWPRVRTHLMLLWNSLLATFAEWLGLNGPYALFTARFGVGPALIVLDTGMKLLRMALTVVRNLSEIALPRVSRAVLNGAVADARRTVVRVMAVSSLPAIGVAVILLWRDQLLWDALLGPNNVMPAGVGAPFALANLAGVAFQAGSHLIGHVGRLAEIRIFMIAAICGFVAVASYVLIARPSPLDCVWAVASSFLLSSAAGLWAIWRVLSQPREPAAA